MRSSTPTITVPGTTRHTLTAFSVQIRFSCGSTTIPLQSFIRSAQTINAFTYVGNSPPNFSDPLGLSPDCGYYGTRCAEVISRLSQFYFCTLSPLVCNNFPGADCYRRCLQNFDANNCIPLFGRKDRFALGAACAEIGGHIYCLSECDLAPVDT